MKKISVFLLLLCVLLTLSLSGCHSEAQQPELPPVPEIPADYLYLSSETLYFSYGAWQDETAFLPVISAFPLVEDDIKILFNDSLLSEEFWLSKAYESAEVTMPFYVYQIYRGKDWAAFAAQEELLQELSDRHDDSTEAYAKYEEMRDEYLEDYLQLQETNLLPVLYYYRIYVRLPRDVAFSGVQEVTLQINDKIRTFPIGEIRYDANAQLPEGGTALTSACSLAGWNVKCPNTVGIFRENEEVTFCVDRAIEDVTISDIYLWEDEREISNIRILITQPNDPEAAIRLDANGAQNDAMVVADYIWDGKTPISLKKGERICVSFSFHEPRLADKLTGYTQYYLTLEYQTENGDTYYNLHWYPMLVEPYSADPHEIYLAHELGIDVLSYYENYYLAE